VNDSTTVRRPRLALGGHALLFFSLGLVIASGTARAESPIDPSFEISLLAGGAFGGTLGVEDGDISMEIGWAANAIAAIRLRSDEGRLLTLSYMRQRTPFTVALDGQPEQKVDVDVGFIHVGGEIDGEVGKRFKPFFGLSIGATHFSPLSSSASTEWFFSAGFYGGTKIAFGEHFGLRLQGRMLGTVIGGEKSVICVSGSGGACLISASGTSGLMQGDFMAGVYVAF
jgi:hypothetical protein